jgi:hypothetical protein
LEALRGKLSSRMKRPLVIAVLVLAAGLLVVWLARRDDRRSPSRRAEVEDESPTAAPVAAREGASSNRAGSRSTPVDAAAPPDLPPLDRQRSDAMRAAIHALFAAQLDARAIEGNLAAPSPIPARGTMPTDGGALRSYIRDRVHEDLFPLARECYARALTKNPTLAGRLIVNFRIVGDERVGGVVDTADIDPKSDLDNAELSQCVRESMMSVYFDAPPGAQGEVTVTYPIEFSPGDPPDAQ